MRRSASVVACLTLVVAGCSSPFSASESSGGFISGDGSITVLEPADREPLPTIGGETLEGEELSTEQFEGQVLVLNVWGSWCAPCRVEAAALEQAATDLADEGVQFVGIDIRDSLTSAQQFQEEQGVTYPSIFDPDSSTLLQVPSSLYPVATPTTYVVDHEGKVAVRILDKTTAPTLTGLVEDVLAEQEAA
jgi:peroxiredoxin